MKKVILTVVVFLMLAGVAWTAETQDKLQKYNVTITIEYKDIDLKALADKEAAIKKVMGDANKIDIQFQKDCPSWKSSTLQTLPYGGAILN